MIYAAVVGMISILVVACWELEWNFKLELLNCLLVDTPVLNVHVNFYMTLH